MSYFRLLLKIPDNPPICLLGSNAVQDPTVDLLRVWFPMELGFNM